MERLELHRATQGGFKRRALHLDGRFEQRVLLDDGFAPRQFEYSSARPGELVFGTLGGEVVKIGWKMLPYKLNYSMDLRGRLAALAHTREGKCHK